MSVCKKLLLQGELAYLLSYLYTIFPKSYHFWDYILYTWLINDSFLLLLLFLNKFYYTYINILYSNNLASIVLMFEYNISICIYLKLLRSSNIIS